MKADQIPVIFTVCFSLVLVADQLLISEACGITEGRTEPEAAESSRDGVVEKLVLPLRLAAIISTTATAVAWSKYSSTHKDYMNAKDMGKISEYYDRSNRYYKLRNGLIVVTGILWGANLATLWLKPPPEVDEFESFSEMGEMSSIVSARWRIYHTGNALVLSWSQRFMVSN